MTAPTEDLIAHPTNDPTNPLHRLAGDIAAKSMLEPIRSDVDFALRHIRALQQEVEELRALHQKVMRRSTRDGMGGKVSDLLDNQAWIVLSHVASQLSDHWNDPNLMEKWQDAWADGEVQKGYFTPHRGVAAWISRAVIARSALTGSAQG